jgi:dephospho-CoA kinase
MNDLFVIGLGGGISKGKSTLAKFLDGFGFPIFDADKAVHKMYAPDGAAVGPVGAAFPEALRDGSIDRDALRDIVLGDLDKWDQLDRIVHPLVKEAAIVFLNEQRAKNAPVAVLDVPLLFTAGFADLCNITACVSAHDDVQEERALLKMSKDVFRAFWQRQLAEAEKCKKADYVVPTDTTLDETKEYVRKLLTDIGLVGEGSQNGPKAGGSPCTRYGLTKKAP